MSPEDQATLQLIVRCDPTFLILHIKSETNFDAALLEKVFALAKDRADQLLKVEQVTQ